MKLAVSMSHMKDKYLNKCKVRDECIFRNKIQCDQVVQFIEYWCFRILHWGQKLHNFDQNGTNHSWNLSINIDTLKTLKCNLKKLKQLLLFMTIYSEKILTKGLLKSHSVDFIVLHLSTKHYFSGCPKWTEI